MTAVTIHPHAMARAAERGASAAEIEASVLTGDPSPAKHGRTQFRRNLPGPWVWRERRFDTKQLEVYAVREDGAWLAITVIVKYF